MGISEVCSQISRKGSKAGSNPPKNMNTQTNPSGPGPHQPTPSRSADSVPPQPPHGASSRHSEETKEEPLCRS
jgi:hypothetical protein